MLIPHSLTNFHIQNNTVQPSETSFCFLLLLTEQETTLSSYLLQHIISNENTASCLKRGNCTIIFAQVPPENLLGPSFGLVFTVYFNPQELWLFSIALHYDTATQLGVLGMKKLFSKLLYSYKVFLFLIVERKSLRR